MVFDYRGVNCYMRFEQGWDTALYMNLPLFFYTLLWLQMM